MAEISESSGAASIAELLPPLAVSSPTPPALLVNTNSPPSSIAQTPARAKGRTWWQFRISTLFWLTLVVGVVAQWRADLQTVRQDHQTQLAERDRLEQMARVEQLQRWQKEREWMEMVFNNKLQRQELPRSGKLRLLVRITPDIYIARHRGARVFDNKAVTIGEDWQGDGSDLVHVAGLPELRSLHLDQAPITKNQFAYIGYLVQLKELQIDLPQFRPTWFRFSEQLTELEVLNVSGTNMDDELLTQVQKSCPNLKHLILRGTVVTSDGIQLLKSRRPRLKVYVQ